MPAVGFLYFLAWALPDQPPIVTLRLFARRNFLVVTVALSVGYGLFFGNVVLLTPPEVAERVHARMPAEVDLAAGVASGACRLPNDAGLVFKALGRETAQVRASVRAFWAVAREEATGCPLPPPFFWR